MEGWLGNEGLELLDVLVFARPEVARLVVVGVLRGQDCARIVWRQDSRLSRFESRHLLESRGLGARNLEIGEFLDGTVGVEREMRV